MKNASEMSVEELRAAYERIQQQKARRKAKLTPAQLERRRAYGVKYRANRAAIEARAEQLLKKEGAADVKPNAGKQPPKK
jgi:hypothetical protein